jgi:hypothetical protein
MTGKHPMNTLKKSNCNNGIGFAIKVVNSTIKLKKSKK